MQNLDPKPNLSSGVNPLNQNFTNSNGRATKQTGSPKSTKSYTGKFNTTIKKKVFVKSNSRLKSKGGFNSKNLLKKSLKTKRVLSLPQILNRLSELRQKRSALEKRQKPIKPIIPPKSLIIILKDKPEKAIYNRRIIDYKHCGLLQKYIGLGGKILPRRQTKLTAKQQRYVSKTIKSARIMGLLPFISKERGFFR